LYIIIVIIHLSAIASVVSDIDADLINFVEVESCDELKFLIDDPSLSGKGYLPYMIQGTDTATGQDVGMLTRVDPQISLYRTEKRVAYPVPTSTCTSTYTGTKGVSKHYVTTVNINNMNVAVIGAHLLAYPDDQGRCLEREAQASVLANMIQSYVDQKYEIIVFGDFNDFDKDVADRNDNVPISQVLSILKGETLNYTLTNVATLAAKEDRYSDWWDENEDCVYELTEVSMIDHILLSEKLYNKVSNFYFAYNEYTQACDDFYSDHFALVVDFDL